MKRMTLARVVEQLVQLISSDIIYGLLFLILFLLALYLMFSDKMNKKEKRIIQIIYILVFVGLFIYYGSSFLSFLDYLINKIFLIIYFPNLAAYVIMILIASAIFIKSIFSKRINSVIRNINIGVYMIILYFLFLLGQVVLMHKINIYSDLAVYQNEEMMILVEITMILFSIWIIILLVYQSVRFYISKRNRSKTKENFKEVSNKINEEFVIDGFTIEEYKLLSAYLKEIKKNKE